MTESLGALHQELAGVVLAGRQLPEVLTEIVQISRRAVPAADASSITLIRNDRAFTPAYDGQLAVDADEMQYERGYGPCLDAGRSGTVFLVADMGAEERWPDYAMHASGLGVGSSLSIPLPFQGATIGALNMYAGRARAFGESDIPAGEEVAAFVAIAVGNAEASARAIDDVANMRRAMASRAVIEQAKGILVERYRSTPDQAFQVLVTASMTTNTKLRDIADHLVRTGELTVR